MLGVANKPFMLSVIMLNVVMLSVFMLNVVMLSVFMLNVVKPRYYPLTNIRPGWKDSLGTNALFFLRKVMKKKV